MNFLKPVLIAFILVSGFLHSHYLQAQKNSDDIIGVWLVAKKDGKVEIYKQGNLYFGKITWLNEPNNAEGKPKTDKNNPDEKKQNQAILGLTIIKNLTWNGEAKWEDASVYDPNTGKTYSALVKMKDKNTLEMTGYIGMSFIGRSETWTRVK
jgi:uncharacterized protein (DUF2147 family)